MQIRVPGSELQMDEATSCYFNGIEIILKVFGSISMINGRWLIEI